MPLPRCLVRLLAWALLPIAGRRPPDLIIGGGDRPYMRRWFLIPRNRWVNAYLHQFLRSDDDRALHDHPWVNCSILLVGAYDEHTISAGGIHHRTHRGAGAIKLRGARAAHRIELSEGECWTLFLTGPRLRAWGFHCPQGWRHWRQFTAADDPGQVGPGCD